MKIDYSDKAKKFVVDCPFAENFMIQTLPNKRWQKRLKVWHVSVLSRSSEYMLTKLAKFMTPTAVEVAKESMAKIQIRREHFPTWYPFKTQPFDHQRRALNHSWGLPYDAFFMEMGTGKTKTAIDLNSARIMAGDISSMVIFCPLAVCQNWVNELAIHSPIPDLFIQIVHELTDSAFNKINQQIKATNRPKVFIVGIESFSQGLKKGRAYTQLLSFLAHSGKYTALVDECHLIKNPDAIRSMNIEFFCENATYRYVMTGTPIAQGILDLYQEFKILDPNIIGMDDFYSFKNRYAEKGGYEGKQIIGYCNVEELMEFIRPFVFQCTKAEALDLPEKLYTTRRVKMTEEQAKVYRGIKQECEAFVKDALKKGPLTKVEVDTVLTKYGTMQQITGGFIRHKVVDENEEFVSRETTVLVESDNNPKIKELLAIAEENPGKKIIVWAKYRQEIAMIVEALNGAIPGSTCEYHGGLSTADRQLELEAFKTDWSKLFFISNQQTGGTGLTINESHLVVYYSNGLQLVHRLQSEDRNHRIGQKNAVLYVDLVCAGTVDEDIIESLRNKKDVADYVSSQMAAS